jgi:oligopeptide/dipeptide ABC transporter ATP-binding protein
MKPLLSVRGLKTEFATVHGTVHAVDGVDLEVGEGEVVGLVGESGCGKSVTALSIMYLVPQPPGRIADGEIWFKEVDLLAGGTREVVVKRRRKGRLKVVRHDTLIDRHQARMSKIRGREISMIFQEPMSSLNPVVSVGYQVAEVFLYQRRRQICDGILSRKELGSEDLERFEQVVAAVDPTEREHRLAEFCVQSGLPADKVSTIANDSQRSRKGKLEAVRKLGEHRSTGSRWFINLMKRLDILETERTTREWQALSHTTLAKRAMQAFDPSRTPEASSLPPLAKVSLQAHAVRLAFRLPPTEEHRSRVEAIVRDKAQEADGAPFRLVQKVSLGTEGIDLAFAAAAAAGFMHETEYRSRTLLYRLLMAIPLLRTRLMKPLEEEARRQVLDLLKLVRIPEPTKVYHEYPHELSGGMQQRVMIAIALACDPALMIADEPTTSLDVTTQAQILKLIRDLRTRVNSAILYITHDLAVIAELCDRVAVMYAGKIVEDAPVDELFARPLHPYAQGLLESIVSMDSLKVEVGGHLPTIPGTVPDLIDPPKGCRFHPRCKFAFERCKLEDPLLLDRGAGHKAACHLYDEGGAHGPNA